LKFTDRIKHIHAHDSFGGSAPEDDLHLPIGEGGY
jgi:sugar phosphate isomerase/epimerase